MRKKNIIFKYFTILFFALNLSLGCNSIAYAGLSNYSLAEDGQKSTLTTAQDEVVVDDSSSSLGIIIVFVILLVGVAGGAFFFISKLKNSIGGHEKKVNEMQKLAQVNDAKARTFEGQVKKMQQAYQKSIEQKKQMKQIFAVEYDKLVGKYKQLAKQKSEEKNEEVVSEELKEANKSLEKTQALLIQSEKMSSLGQLTAGIAHEINNPVNFVANGINTLKDNFSELNVFIENYKRICELETIEEIQKYYKIQREDDHHFTELQTSTNESLDDVEYGTTRITEIVNGLRVFSRQDESDIKEAELNQIIDNAIIILKPKYKKKAKILKDFDSSIETIKCLPGQLNQALVNLIGNACDAIDFKGTINVKTQEIDDDTIRISIKDNGKGMTDDTIKKIFDPFFTTKAIGKGTGLGLSITYGIIEKHNGTIEVESEVGKGTEFIITLPKKLKKVKKPLDPALA